MIHRRRYRPVAQRINRRQFIGRAGVFAGAVALGPSILAACGGDDDDDSSGGGGGSDSIAISSWLGYMSDQSLADFEAAIGITPNYDETINDNNEYFTKIRPNLSQGEGIGREGMVLTDWMASRLINQVDPPWVQQFDEAAFPNKSNMLAVLASPEFDPQRLYSAPWATGITGIAYNISTTGGEVRTVDDFLNVSGTKTVLTEMRDTVGLFMQATGADPANPSVASAEPAFDALQKALDDGQIDGANGQDYVADLGAGNLAAAFAWSGDVAQITLDNPDVRFAVPESGGMLWSDNFLIPIGTDKVTQATQWINFFYDPANAAVLTAEIQYISPVQGVAEALTAMGGDAAALVDNPLVVPTDEFLASVSIFGTLDETAEEEFDQRFSEILGTG
ncbi:MAG: spermidine/putrescine ABC transporter substrate-binding protein [Acidimicrobiia bacterium]